MSFKIRISAILTNRLHPIYLVLAVVTTLFLIDGLGYFIFNFKVLKPFPYRLGKQSDLLVIDHQLYWAPFYRPYSETISWAVDTFADKNHNTGPFGNNESTLALIILSLVVAPSVFYKCWQLRKSYVCTQISAKRLLLLYCISGLSGYVLFWTFAPSVLGGQIKGWQYLRTLDGWAATSAERASAEMLVNSLSLQAQVYRSKAGSFVSPNDSSRSGETLLSKLLPLVQTRDLGIFSATKRETLHPIIDVVSKDSILIWAVSDMPATDDDGLHESTNAGQAGAFRNRDGRLGLIQVHVSLRFPNEFREVEKEN